MSATSSSPAPSSSAPISAKKLAANRANAQHSTGPKTPEGKQRSSKNACTHRLYSPDLLLPGEDEALLRTFRRALLLDLRPRTSLEAHAADRVVALTWRLRRVASAERFLTEWATSDYADRTRRNNEDEQARRDQVRDRMIQAGYPADRAADDTPPPPPPGHPDYDPDDYADYLETHKPLPDPHTPPDPGYHLARDLHLAHQSKQPAHRATPFERLLTAETRLQSLLDRNMKELRKLQSDRRNRQDDPDEDDLSPVPHYLEDPWDDDEEEEDDTTAAAAADESDTDDAPPADRRPPSPARATDASPADHAPPRVGEGGGEGRAQTSTPQNEPTATPAAPLPPQNEPTTLLQSAQHAAVQSILNRKKGG